MKQSVNESQFRDLFLKLRPENFSYDGLGVLFSHLEDIEQDTKQEIELDVIELCCTYNEDTIENVLKSYNLESLNDLERKTSVIKVNDTRIIYQTF